MSRTTISLPAEVRSYLVAVGVDESEHLVALRDATALALDDRAVMLSSPEQAAFLAWLIKLTGARNCVEIGTFTGYNALSMALAMPADGKVLCCDVSAEYTDLGRPFWDAAGVGHKIEVRIAPALQTLDEVLANGGAETFDVAFIDADKAGYCDYYERALRLLRPGGVIAVDNVLWSGRVAEPEPHTESTTAIRALNARIAADTRVDRVMLPVGDGLFLARKRAP